MREELASLLILSVSCFSAYQMISETGASKSFPLFTLASVMAEDLPVQDFPELLLILVLPILVIVMLLAAMIVGGNDGSDSMRI